MGNNAYDVVIVGSGVAGSVVAKLLTNAGKKVLLLEAGLQAGIALDPDGAYKNYQEYIQSFYEAPIKATNSPYPDIMDAQSINVLDMVKLKDDEPSTKGYLVQKGPLPFASDCVRGPGGTTLHWLGTTLRMLPNDFRMKTKYGVAVDWPFTYEDLKPYYEMAEFEIGVSGDVHAQKYPDTGKDFFGPGYEFPMKEIPQSYMDEVLISEINMKPDVVVNEETYKIYCISTPQGRNSEPNTNYPYTDVAWDPGSKKIVLKKADDKDYEYNPVGSVWDPYTGQRCEGNASCVPICPVQAKYNALKTLKKSDLSNLEIRTQSVASRLLINEKSNWISGVEYKRYEHGNAPAYTTEVATGTIYVLAANAIENAKLLLASGAANSSDQVGRNLMDHMVMMAWGLNKSPVYPYRGPGSTTNIATFRDGEFRKDHTAWICPLDNWGWAWPVYSPGSDVSNAVNAGMFGKELRNKLEHDLTRQVFIHHECEQIPEPNNRVTIDPEYKDQIGNYRPVIEYGASDYMRKAFEAANQVTEQLFANCNIDNYTAYKETDIDYVTYNGKGYSFAGAGHIVGTHRMGASNTDSVVNPDMRTWDHDNLYLVGCGNMPTLGTSNPTLTMTALTIKATEAILKQLEQ